MSGTDTPSATTHDVVVLGAGMIGVSVALHLQARGLSVVMVDRRAPGEEASAGNAGLIQSASVVPYGFPRDLPSLLKYAFNRSTALHYDWRSIPAYLSWLYRYWRESSESGLAKAAQDLYPLISVSVDEHRLLMERSGTSHLARPGGWLEAYRSPASFERAVVTAKETARQFNLNMTVFDAEGLRALEPSLAGPYVGAVQWVDSLSVSNPAALTKGYADCFVKNQGQFRLGDAQSLTRVNALSVDSLWQVDTDAGPVLAQQAVVALGVWSQPLTQRLGYRIPMLPKKGYHMHYQSAPGWSLNLPVIDTQEGYALVPMDKGLRLSTGVQLALPDVEPNPVQVARAFGKAQQAFQLGQPLDAEPWCGMRPCLPDMRPVIGAAPRHDRLWFAFGHNHHGLTLGPSTGRLLADLMTGSTPFVNPKPFSPQRFES